MKAIMQEDKQTADQVAHPQEQGIEGAAARLSNTLQSAGDGVIVTDVEGLVEFLNSAAERLIGLQNAEAHGRPLHEVLRLEERHAGEIRGNLIELAVISEETVALGKDLLLIPHSGHAREIEGEISVRTAAGSATGTVVTFRDVTARNWDELRRREEQKMRAVGQLAGAVAHELNNLLTVVIGHSETLHAMYPELAPVRDHTSVIHQAADGIAAVTRRLLTLSGRQLLIPKAVNLNALLEQVTPKLKSLLPAEIEFVTSLEPNLGAVLVDAGQMEEALLDLVRHSRDRMPTGGKLGIATANVVMDETLRARHVRRYVQLTVADSGLSLRGIAMEELFEPSWNAEMGRPSGLGLFAVRTAVSAAHGHLSIEGESGEGARFVLLLPQVEELPAPLAPVRESKTGSRPAELGQATVLLVEDDHAIRILLRNSFEQRGYRVIEARDGAEALLQADLHEEPIDLLITDVAMPNMDGPTLARSLAETRPETKILLTSGCPNELVDIQQLVQRGAHYVQKPFSQRELLARVEAILSEAQQL